MPLRAQRMPGYETVSFTPEVKEKSSSEIDIMCLEQVDWYHGTLTRNHAETVLMQHGKEGSYLLRKSNRHEGYSVSVKSQDSVKHFVLNYNNQQHFYEFGNATFKSLKELLDHFQSCPILSKESGLAVTLKFPYSVSNDEPEFYEEAEGHAILNKTKNIVETKPTKAEAVATKSGYLQKRGNIHKNWNKRWFTVERRFLKYFKNKGTDTPIRELDISLAKSVAESAIDNKTNCFLLELPHRTFYFVAETPAEAKEWIDFFQWKIDYYKSLDI